MIHCSGQSWRLASIVLVVALGCRRAEPPPPESGAPSPPEPEILHFPARVRADDPEVNAFISTVIGTCAAGDYDAFRRLWSVRDDPFPRDRFYRAWRSVWRVEIQGLKPVRHPETGDVLYAVRAHVELDPAVREPQRDVTMLLIKEQEQWRLTTPPKSLPEGLFDAEQPASQPHATSAPSTE